MTEKEFKVFRCTECKYLNASVFMTTKGCVKCGNTRYQGSGKIWFFENLRLLTKIYIYQILGKLN